MEIWANFVNFSHSHPCQGYPAPTTKISTCNMDTKSTPANTPVDTPETWPFINSHTHIFTGDHVPPYLAKSYLPFPFYLILRVDFIVQFFRWWNKFIDKIIFSPRVKRLVRVRTWIAQFLIQIGPLATLAGFWLTVAVILYFNHLLAAVSPKFFIERLMTLEDWLFRWHLFIRFSSHWTELVIVVISCLAFPSVRQLFFTIARYTWKFMASLPGKSTRELAKRYLNIGRYAFHEKQSTIYGKLIGQYPAGTGIVVLPMDMEFMHAGKPHTRYREQMAKLAQLKDKPANRDKLFPLVFADPRRFVPLAQEPRTEAGDKIYFAYKWNTDTNKIILEDCFIKDYIEGYGFRGFKIYPALGYYPFDPALLPLWKYAADNNIPIMTHCIRGTIFYRGPKQPAWNKHPVFQQSMEKDETKPADQQSTYAPLDLPQMNNVDFSYNFTHPMNYLCLLEEQLLRRVIAKELAANPASDLSAIFGYTDESTPLKRDLRDLKICLAHFGGDDEWAKYFEKDRYIYSNELIQHPEKGIDFFHLKGKDEPSFGKPELIWKYVDWYSIICSIMLQFPNVYADISYILHDTANIQPLLKQTLQNPKLRDKVLYGTDFFVVRNHKSDKNMAADYTGGLSVSDFIAIAKVNPRKYLTNNIHGRLPI